MVQTASAPEKIRKAVSKELTVDHGGTTDEKIRRKNGAVVVRGEWAAAVPKLFSVHLEPTV